MKLPAPPFGARRLLLVGTGAISIVQLPFWLNWLGTTYPDLEVQVVLTRSGERFVSRHAISALTRLVPLDDRWPEEPQVDAIHATPTREPDGCRAASTPSPCWRMYPTT